MARTVQLSDEAYGTLAALKRPGESFSDAVLRLARTGKDPSALLGLGPLREDFDYRKLRDASRDKDLERLRRFAEHD